MRMRRSLVVGAAVIALAVAGCSKTETTTQSAGTTTTTAKQLTKAELITKGDAICKDYRERTEQIPEPEDMKPATIEKFFKATIALQREQIAALEALGKPSDGAAEYEKALSTYKAAIDEIDRQIPAIAEDPQKMLADDSDLSKKLDEANKAAQAFGFKECGSDGSGSSGSGDTGATSGTGRAG